MERERDVLCGALQRAKDAAAEWERECMEAREAAIRQAGQEPDASAMRALETELARLEQELAASRESMRLCTCEHEEKTLSLQRTLEGRDAELLRLQSELEAVRAELDEAQIRLLMAARAASAERDSAALQSCTFPHLSRALEMEREARRLQAENARLQDERRSMAFVAERLREAEVRLARGAQTEDRLARVEAENAELHSRLGAAAAAKSTGVVGEEAPGLRMDIIGLQEELAGLRGSLAAKTREMERLGAELKGAQTASRDTCAQLEAAKQELASLQHQLQMARLEAQSLRDRLM